MALVARIFVVLFSFALACLAAAAVMTFALLLPNGIDLLNSPVDQQIIVAAVGLSAVFFSLYALLPAMVIIALAEGFLLRAVLFYALAGAALALCLAYGLDLGLLHNPDGDFGARGAEIGAAAGIVAGFVYWALAGRNAGAWRKPAFTSSPSQVHPPA